MNGVELYTLYERANDEQSCGVDGWADLSADDRRMWDRVAELAQAVDEQSARQILGEAIQKDGALYDGNQYTRWSPGDSEIVLDGRFGIEELEAIVWWIRHNEAQHNG